MEEEMIGENPQPPPRPNFLLTTPPPPCKGEVAGKGGGRGNYSLDGKTNFSKGTKMSKTWLDLSEDLEWDDHMY